MPVSSRRAFHIALLVAIAFFMENLDSTVIVTALPQMAQSFHASPVDLNIGLTAYMLAVAVFLPISGWMVDRFGARLIFVSAIVMFTLSSVLCGLSVDQVSFTVCRVLQGIGGAMMMPVGRLIILQSTEKRDRIKMIAYIVWPGLVAPVLGPPVGGFITTFFSWRWIFFLNIPLGILGIVLALALIGEGHTGSRRRFDMHGFLLCAGACVALSYGLELLGRVPTPWRPMSIFLGAGVVLGFFAIRQLRRAKEPLINLAVLRIPTYAMTLRGGSLFRLSISTVPFLLPLMFQIGFALDAFRSGLLVLAVFAGSLGMKAIATHTLRRFGFRRVLLINGTLTMAAVLGCVTLTPATPYAVIAAVLFVGGLTRSLQFSAINSIAFADVDEAELSGANTLANVVQQLSQGLGFAFGAMSLRFAGVMLHGGVGGPTVADFRVAFVMLAVMIAVSTLDALPLSEDAGSAVSGHHAAA